ncbi:uncharacterized protein LOC141679488 [Apium graveolens]|uniref:uncharacterized protein LOC141679488 n=1 Tax=Apium graveolens TaxID=4045 RepID=UPI003D7A26E7
MELIVYDPLDTIDTTTYEWKCRVRVQSFWKGQNRETQEFWGINMILIDDSNNRIHVFASSKHCDDRFKTLKEGDIYIVKNFKVKNYVGDETSRPVRTKNHIFFTPHTEFVKDRTEGLQIEKYAFDLFDMAEMEKIDMVGKLENVQELIITNKDEVGKSRFKFEISDGRYFFVNSNKVKVTLFDLFGQHIEKELSKADKDNTFIIISCARVGRYEGVPHLSNYSATRIFINPDHYSVTELKLSWGKKKTAELPSTVITVTKPTTEAETIKFLTVKEIKALNADFKKPSTYCQVIAKQFSDQNNWFRLCIFCSDDTGSLAIVFPDDGISRIIDKTVIDLQTDCVDEKDGDKFPEILNTLLRQNYTIILVITKDNLTKGSTIYEAKDIVQKVETVGIHDPNTVRTVEMNVAEMEEISVLSDTEYEARATQTPDTGKSTNMKTRARKKNGATSFQCRELFWGKKFKNIKWEKLCTKAPNNLHDKKNYYCMA